jgi:cation diffusion facilitator CzcD-associated flavoprotein CzcO
LEPEHLDVLIVGAGLSGIGAACHLRDHCPGTSFALLEARESSGGTWDLFRYPGVRSDSDMFTLGYSFNPWRSATALADGPSILSYVRDTARDYGIEPLIRYNRRVTAAAWSSEQARWTVTVENTETGARDELTCSFLYSNTGYYRYDEGYAPEFPGAERFRGHIVHPQHWPEDLDYEGKRVVVIGSGATAVTLVPAMAGTAAHVTMLQRSPSYVLSIPGSDPLADVLKRLLPDRVVYPLLRLKNVVIASMIYRSCRRAPATMRRLLRRGAARRLPPGYDLDTHFNPTYDPWDQRMCLVPDGDLFDAISSGNASIATDRIETFTEDGLRLRSGAELEADIIITATGLNLLMLGGIELTVDGRAVDLSETVGYKGTMLSGVPNLAFTVGYTNASWTLKADLVAGYVCRLLAHMNEHGYTVCTPRAPDPAQPRMPLLDLASGYVLRSIDQLPRQGAEVPWRMHQSYFRDAAMMRRAPVQDGAIEFSRAMPAREQPSLLAA